MRLDRCDQQVRVIRPPIIDLVVGDDLIFRLLQLHQVGGGLLRMMWLNRLELCARVRAGCARGLLSLSESGTWLKLVRRPQRSCCTTSAERFTPRRLCEKRLGCLHRPVELSIDHRRA